MLGRFFRANQSISRAMTPIHVHEGNVFAAYRKLAAMLLSHPDVTRVLDVGAGKSWQLPEHYKRWYGIRLLGADIEAREMEDNDALDEKIACDVVHEIPVAPGSIDLITVRSGIEHFRDNGQFLANAYAALRPGGFLLAQFPGRYAPFAIANRWLPRQVTLLLLRHLMGSNELGFEAHYDRTHYSAFRRLVQQTGFETCYYLPGYYSSTYFEFFVPLFSLSYTFDMIRSAIGIKNLASYHLWVLRKPAQGNATAEAFVFYAWDDLSKACSQNRGPAPQSGSHRCERKSGVQ